MRGSLARRDLLGSLAGLRTRNRIFAFLLYSPKLFRRLKNLQTSLFYVRFASPQSYAIDCAHRRSFSTSCMIWMCYFWQQFASKTLQACRTSQAQWALILTNWTSTSLYHFSSLLFALYTIPWCGLFWDFIRNRFQSLDAVSQWLRLKLPDLIDLRGKSRRSLSATTSPSSNQGLKTSRIKIDRSEDYRYSNDATGHRLEDRELQWKLRFRLNCSYRCLGRIIIQRSHWKSHSYSAFVPQGLQSRAV